MVPIITLLVTLSVTLLITRIATVLLVHTGLSRDVARFQARSALTGVGFSTAESELVMDHPLRRRIILSLMLVGNAGIVTVVATLVVGLTGESETSTLLLRLTVLAGGLFLLLILSLSQWVDRQLSKTIEWALRHLALVDLRDYVSLFRLSSGYAVCEIQVGEDDWLADRDLAELRLPSEGVLVLGVQREDGTWRGAPTGDTRVLPGDTLLVYGPTHRVDELNERRANEEGQFAHLAAVDEQRQRQRVEEEADAAV